MIRRDEPPDSPRRRVRTAGGGARAALRDV